MADASRGSRGEHYVCIRNIPMTIVEKPWYRSGLGELEGAATAHARSARAHHCHNDFITNPGARGGRNYTGSPSADRARGGVGATARRRQRTAVFLSLHISIRFFISRHRHRSPISLLHSCRRRRRCMFRACTHTHAHNRANTRSHCSGLRLAHSLSRTNLQSLAHSRGACAYIFIHSYARARVHTHTHTHHTENAHNNNIIYKIYNIKI